MVVLYLKKSYNSANSTNMEILILYNEARELKKGVPADLICEQEVKNYCSISS